MTRDSYSYSMSNQKKIKATAFRIAFLMPHQKVDPDLLTEVKELVAEGQVNKDSPEYLAGAHDALEMLINFLAQKGPPTC